MPLSTVRTRPSSESACSELSAPTRVAVNQTSSPRHQASPSRLPQPSEAATLRPERSKTTTPPRSSSGCGCG